MERGQVSAYKDNITIKYKCYFVKLFECINYSSTLSSQTWLDICTLAYDFLVSKNIENPTTSMVVIKH